MRNALVHDGWTITHDPLHLRWGTKDMYVDLGAERFLGAELSPYQYLPFGGGTRRCVGMGLAVYEMKLVLAELLGTADASANRPIAIVDLGRRRAT